MHVGSDPVHVRLLVVKPVDVFVDGTHSDFIFHNKVGAARFIIEFCHFPGVCEHPENIDEIQELIKSSEFINLFQFVGDESFCFPKKCNSVLCTFKEFLNAGEFRRK